MENIKGYLTVLLVAAALCTPCSSRCIDVDLYPISNCSRYYREVEEALLANETNKYQLREEFFPSSQTSPFYGYVTYSIELKHTSELCNYGILNEWTSSILFAYIPPYLMSSTTLELIVVLFSIIKFPDDKIPKFILVSGTNINDEIPKSVAALQLSLNLTTTEIECDALKAVLEDLTPRVRNNSLESFPWFFLAVFSQPLIKNFC